MRPERERDQVVAHRRDPWTEPFSFGSEHHHDPARVVRLVVVGGRSGGGPVDPRAGVLGLLQEVGEVLDPRDRQVLDRARRRLADRGRDLGAATLGNDDPGRPRRLRGAAIAPRFCGSVISSRAISSGSVGASSSRRPRTDTDPRARRPPVGIALRTLLEFLGGRDRHIGVAPFVRRRRPDAVHLALAAQRLPDGVAAVDEHPPRRDRALGHGRGELRRAATPFAGERRPASSALAATPDPTGGRAAARPSPPNAGPPPRPAPPCRRPRGPPPPWPAPPPRLSPA